MTHRVAFETSEATAYSRVVFRSFFFFCHDQIILPARSPRLSITVAYAFRALSERVTSRSTMMCIVSAQIFVNRFSLETPTARARIRCVSCISFVGANALGKASGDVFAVDTRCCILRTYSSMRICRRRSAGSTDAVSGVQCCRPFPCPGSDAGHIHSGYPLPSHQVHPSPTL